MLAKFAILVLAAGVFLQPILAVVPGAEDCCADQAATPSEFAVQADDHQCCCCEADDATGQDAPSDRERPDQRPRGCDCPKSCCVGVVKAPLGVVPSGAAAEWRDSIEQVRDDTPDLAGDAWTSRLKRPPRAVAAV